MYSLYGRCAVIILSVGAIVQSLSAQSFLSISNIDQSAFPTVRADVYALDQKGEPIQGLTSADFGLTENGFSRQVTAVAGPASTTPSPISLGIMVNTYGQGDLAVAGVRQAVDALRLPSSEAGVTMVDGDPYIVQDLTTDRSAVLSAVDRLKPSFGADLHSLFYDSYAGGVPFLSGRPNKKTLILITDLHSSAFDLDTNTLWQDAAREHISVYIILLNGTDYFGYFERLSTRTGGRLFDRVTTVPQIETIVREIVLQAQYTPYSIQWRSDISCEAARTTTLSLPGRGLTSTSLYTAPPESVPALLATPSGISFGSVAAGATVDTVVTLTAVNRPVTVWSIAADDPSFTVDASDVGQGFTLRPGEERSIRVRYTASEGRYRIARIGIESDVCRSPMIHLSAGNAGQGVALRTLKLNAPNGGERFVAGADTLVAWEGVLPQDTVRLESSTDDGNSWQVVADRVAGLQYRWNVPAVPGSNYLMRVVQVRTGTPGDNGMTLKGHAHWVTATAYNNDGGLVATGSYGESMVRIWKASTGELLNALQAFSWINTVAFSADGQRLIVADAAGNIGLWDVNTGELIRRILPAGIGGVPTAYFSPDGRRIVSSGGDDAVARVWDASTGELLMTLRGHNGTVETAVYSPDGGRILTGSADGTARVWNAQSGELLQTLSKQGSEVFSAAFSPDGGHVVTGGGDGVAKIWDLKTGKAVATFSGHSARLSSVAFNQEGTHLMTASRDSTAKIWDLGTGKVVAMLVGHTGPICSAAFSPDGYHVVTGSIDRTARIWAVDVLPMQADRSDSLWSIVSPRTEIALQSIDMGTVPVHGRSDSLVRALICNRGDAPLHILGLRISGNDADDFSLLTGGGECTLGPGECRDVTVGFMPTAVGARQARLDVETSGGAFDKSVALLGAGATLPLEVVAAVVDFGKVEVGSVRDTIVQVLLRNAGTAPVSVTALSQIGPDLVSFRTIGLKAPFTMAPNEERAVRLQFAPTAIGRTGGRLAIDYIGSATPAIVSLHGVGTGAAMRIPQPAIAFDPVTCRPDEAASVEIYNDGNSDLVISGADFSGRDAGDFSLATGLLPVTIAPQSWGAVPVEFVPRSSGDKSASMTFVANAVATSDRSVALGGRSDSVGFVVSASALSFDPFENASAIGSLTVTNTGTAPLSWKTPVIVGRFAIESVSPTTTLPGERSDVSVRFIGGTADSIYDATVMLAEEGCGVGVDLHLHAKVRNLPMATLIAPDVAAAAGEIVDAPITVSNADGLIGMGATGISTELRFDASLLYPIDGTPLGTVDGDERVIPLSLPLPKDGGNVVAALHFRAALGRDSVTPLRLENSSPIGGTGTVKAVAGQFTLHSCPVRTPRAFLTAGRLALKQNYPNPAVGSTEFEYDLVEGGRTRLSIADVSGRLVAVLVDGDYEPGAYSLAFDTSVLTPGSYLYVLETPTQRVSRVMQIER